MSRLTQRIASVLVSSLILVIATGQLVAQDKRVVVLSFEQRNVLSSIEEVFGGEADIGDKIADLVRARLREHGVEVAEEDVDVHGRVNGSIMVFGRAEGGGEVAFGSGGNRGRVCVRYRSVQLGGRPAHPAESGAHLRAGMPAPGSSPW